VFVLPIIATAIIQVVEGVGMNGWVKVSEQDWVHVAIGNERLIKGGIKSPKFTAVQPGGRCVLKKGQEQQVIALAEKWPVSSIIFVTVDDELALCYALGGTVQCAGFERQSTATSHLISCVLSDVIRPEATFAVNFLRSLDCRLIMLSGDSVPVAEAVGLALSRRGVS
jgi:cation transport ATPase